MIKVKRKDEEVVVFFNGVTVKISTEKVFDNEGDSVVVQIINALKKRLLIKAPEKEFRLPPGLYC